MFRGAADPDVSSISASTDPAASGRQELAADPDLRFSGNVQGIDLP
jgi:hypothetical protein